MTPTNPTHTPPRQMRIPNDEWLPFDQAAKEAGTTRAEAVREFIRWYLRRPGSKQVVRPDAGPWSEAPAAKSEPAAQD